MAGTGKYTAETLAFRAGVPLRTVRYYLQEGLIDPPLGRGRGSHFDDRHLAQLQRARVLHNAGFELQAIRDQGKELAAHFGRAIDRQRAIEAWAAAGSWPPFAPPPAEPGEVDPAHAFRIPMIDGVELLVSRDRPLPSPKVFVDIAMFIRKAFGGR